MSFYAKTLWSKKKKKFSKNKVKKIHFGQTKNGSNHNDKNS